jgi:hypothetical protein
VSCLVARYTPALRYFSFAFAAVGGMVLAAWTGLRWSPAWIAAALFAISAVGVFLLALRPPIEIHETHLQIGRRAIAWSQIRRLDQTGWNAPLALNLTLMDHTGVRLLYPGDLDSCVSLLRHLRRYSREALLDGVPYRQFWGGPPAEAPKQLAPPRYRLLRPEDEEEVERMLQRLRSVGRLDPRGSDEK